MQKTECMKFDKITEKVRRFLLDNDICDVDSFNDYMNELF